MFSPCAFTTLSTPLAQSPASVSLMTGYDSSLPPDLDYRPREKLQVRMRKMGGGGSSESTQPMVLKADSGVSFGYYTRNGRAPALP